MVDYKMFTKEHNEDVQKVVDEITEYLLSDEKVKKIKEFIDVKLEELSEKHHYIVELGGVDRIIIEEAFKQYKKKRDEN